jgi:predicted transcriptional regulator
MNQVAGTARKRSIRIRVLLLENDVRQKDIANDLGVEPPAVSAVISGRTRSLKIEEAIARACKTARENLFPPAAYRHTEDLSRAVESRRGKTR